MNKLNNLKKILSHFDDEPIISALKTLITEMEDADDGNISISSGPYGIDITNHQIEFVDIENGTYIAEFRLNY